jgi:hypothetical protein
MRYFLTSNRLVALSQPNQAEAGNVAVIPVRLWRGGRDAAVV